MNQLTEEKVREIVRDELKKTEDKGITFKDSKKLPPKPSR